MADRIRIGIVGAGSNTRSRHIPGLRAQQGVEIVSVCNRSLESTKRVAEEFSIPKICRHWRDLVESSEIDAVVIGTWPHLHCPITLAAFDCNLHVLTEARMARNAREAHLMYEGSLRHPHLVAQIVPSPFTLRVDQTVQKLIADGYLGEIYAISLTANASFFADIESPLHWRQDRELSGLNVLTLGIWYETLLRWVGEATRVMAMTRVNVKRRKSLQGILQAVGVPDHVDVIAEMACGAQAHLQFSAVTGLARGGEIWLYGRDGTLRYDAVQDKVYGGRRGDAQLQEILVPSELTGGWRVEGEFVNAIRGLEPIRLTTFAEGVRYMQFTEAVARSAASGEVVAVSEI
jgi:predicted dehydrogenase